MCTAWTIISSTSLRDQKDKVGGRIQAGHRSVERGITHDKGRSQKGQNIGQAGNVEKNGRRTIRQQGENLPVLSQERGRMMRDPGRGRRKIVDVVRVRV